MMHDVCCVMEAGGRGGKGCVLGCRQCGGIMRPARDSEQEYRRGSHSDRPGGVTTVLQGGHRAVENRNLVATLMDQYHIVKTMSHVWRPV